MSSWQKRARAVVAVFGIAFAGVVYVAIGERGTPAPLPPLHRDDPDAMLETTGGIVWQTRGTERGFTVRAAKVLSYEDQSTRLFDVHIEVPKRSGRDFVITAREARAGKEQIELHLNGDVRVRASDGFELTTAQATYNTKSGMATAPAAVAFKKARMSGSGSGMTYDLNVDALRVANAGHVDMLDEAGAISMQFSADSVTFDRTENYLALIGSAHVLRDAQTMDAAELIARLSDNEEFVTFIELRQNARVTGRTASLESMAARDIDLDYSDDGSRLEEVTLTENATIAMSGEEGAAGKLLKGNTLELQLAEDGAVTSAVGRERVGLELPGAGDAPPRTIAAEALDATGEPGRGLTAATFTTDVVYTEQVKGGGTPRVARSMTLHTSLERDVVTSATFNGKVVFTEQGLRATSAEAVYVPHKNTLQLKGLDQGGRPHVEDTRITIDAATIDVALERRTMSAAGNVRTTLRAERRTTAGPRQPTETRLPGLLKQDSPANVRAQRLEYRGASEAVYSGAARLWQDDSFLAADRVTINQETGDVTAAGNATSRFMLDGTASSGEGQDIRYEDAKRLVSYVSAGRQVSPTAPPARGRTGAAQAQARVNGPQGNVTGDRIDITLAEKESRVSRVDAAGTVRIERGDRVVTGARLAYFAQDERYVVNGAAGAPAVLTEGCRQSKGNTLTFYGSTNRISIDGNDQIRTQMTNDGPCATSAPR